MHQTNKQTKIIQTNLRRLVCVASWKLLEDNINTIDAVYLSFYLKAVGYNTIADVEIKVLSAENLAKAIKGFCF